MEKSTFLEDYSMGMDGCPLERYKKKRPGNHRSARPILPNRRLTFSHRVAQAAKPFDLGHHLIAILERTNPGRGAGKDQVAGFERHDPGDKGDQHADIENHIARGSHLARLAADTAGNQRIRWVELGVHPRAK